MMMWFLPSVFFSSEPRGQDFELSAGYGLEIILPCKTPVLVFDFFTNTSCVRPAVFDLFYYFLAQRVVLKMDGIKNGIVIKRLLFPAVCNACAEVYLTFVTFELGRVN